MRKIKDSMKQTWAKLFHGCQRLGFDLLPRHFYSEIPDIRQLRNTEAWRQPYSLYQVRGTDLDQQLAFVQETLTDPILEHLNANDIWGNTRDRAGEWGYGKIDTQFLFGFIARHQPARITQIGCGYSTALCLSAAEFAGYTPQITCVEPYPSEFLAQAAKRKQIELIQAPVQDIGFDFFQHLQEGDFFFVDSSHTLGPAGEVTRIVMEMLPRLAPAVHVHFHDIYTPFDFNPHILSRIMFFWHETALLHAFLCMNPGFRINASFAQLHHGKLDALKQILPHYDPVAVDRGIAEGEGDFPSAIYFQSIGNSPSRS